MSRPYRDQDGEAWLRQAKRLKQPLSAVVTFEGRRVARLFGEYREPLESRAHRFAQMVGYRSAEVRIVY